MLKQRIIILAGLTLLTSCGKNNYKYVEGKVNIVATTTMLGDLTSKLGGDKASVTTMMSVGIDPHLYSPRVSDTTAISRSDFLVYGGLHLEGKMIDIFEQQKKVKPVVNSGNVISSKNGTILYDENKTPNPHVWFSVPNWSLVAQGISEELINYDKVNETYYTQLAKNYINELEQLHEWSISRVEEIAPEKRILVTAHDAFAYFAHEYGFEVEAIQGISTSSEASISDINNLVDLVIKKEVKAIFVENSVPKKTIESVISNAKNKGYALKIGGELYSDSLGDGQHSHYIEAIKHNINTIVDALK